MITENPSDNIVDEDIEPIELAEVDFNPDAPETSELALEDDAFVGELEDEDVLGEEIGAEVVDAIEAREVDPIDVGIASPLNHALPEIELDPAEKPVIDIETDPDLEEDEIYVDDDAADDPYTSLEGDGDNYFDADE